MQYEAVYHRTSDNYCYPINENELIINLKTGYDIARVFLLYEDPFQAGILGGTEKWVPREVEIPFKKRLKHHIWWTTTITPPYKRCKYYFKLIDKEGCVINYLEVGFYRLGIRDAGKDLPVFHISMVESWRYQCHTGLGK